MSPEQFEREKSYRVMMAIATTMLNKGLIGIKEYKKIEDTMIRKYSPVIGILGR